MSSDSDRPVSHWTPRELADEGIARGIVASISPRHFSGREVVRLGDGTTLGQILEEILEKPRHAAPRVNDLDQQDHP